MPRLTDAQRVPCDAARDLPCPHDTDAFEDGFASGIAYATKRDAEICRAQRGLSGNPVRVIEQCATAIERADQ